MRCIFISAPVKKSLSFLSMPVQVQHHFDLFLFVNVNNLVLDEVNLRIQLLRRGFPASVEVPTDERAPVIAVDDTVGVDHGKYFEYECASQCEGLWLF